MSDLQDVAAECPTLRRGHAAFLFVVASVGTLLAFAGASLALDDGINSLFDIYFLVALAVGIANAAIAVRLFLHSSDALRSIYLRSSVAILLALPITALFIEIL